MDAYGAQTKTVYEFHGCFSTGVQIVSQESIIPNITVKQIEPSQKSMKQPVGKKIIFVRKCIRSVRNGKKKFEVDKKSNPAVIQFLKTFELI